jgi:hypothetical protein
MAKPFSMQEYMFSWYNQHTQSYGSYSCFAKNESKAMQKFVYNTHNAAAEFSDENTEIEYVSTAC